MNKSMNLCRKIGYFGMAGVKLHIDPHSCRINQNDPCYIKNQISDVQIYENFGTWSNVTNYKRNEENLKGNNNFHEISINTSLNNQKITQMY